MLKRNKLPIFLLAIICMLTVYYVKTPANNDNGTEVGGELDTNTRYFAFAEGRINTLKERSDNIVLLEEIIALDTSSKEEKSDAVLNIAQINQLTGKEITLENSILGMGYEDVLVISEDSNIEISLLTEEFTNAQFVSVALLAKTTFDNNYTVTVNITGPTS